MKASEIINCATAEDVMKARELAGGLETKGYSPEFVAKAKADLAIVESHNLPFASAPNFREQPYNEDGINEHGHNVFDPGVY